MTEPIILSSQREGTTVEAACGAVSKHLLGNFNFALVWGRSTKFNPQRVGLAHKLCDEDVVQVVQKSNTQQKQSKDYAAKVLLCLELLAVFKLLFCQYDGMIVMFLLMHLHRWKPIIWLLRRNAVD